MVDVYFGCLFSFDELVHKDIYEEREASKYFFYFKRKKKVRLFEGVAANY